MKASVKKNRDQFVKSYGTFGKHLIYNQFALKALFKLSKPCEVIFNYTVEGKRISRYQVKDHVQTGSCSGAAKK